MGDAWVWWHPDVTVFCNIRLMRFLGGDADRFCAVRFCGGFGLG